jgi:putative tRNA adenosine deaminase-associated protein
VSCSASIAIVADTDFATWAVVVFQEDDAWQVAQLPPGVSEDLESIVAAVRGQQAGAFALVDVADEFWVAVRVLGGQERFLLSDAGASVEWELAAQVMDRLDLDIPDDDASQDLWPVGELDLFDDLGLDALELTAILADEEAYADEMLDAVARRIGFAEPYERALDALV